MFSKTLSSELAESDERVRVVVVVVRVVVLAV